MNIFKNREEVIAWMEDCLPSFGDPEELRELDFFLTATLVENVPALIELLKETSLLKAELDASRKVSENIIKLIDEHADYSNGSFYAEGWNSCVQSIKQNIAK